MCYKNYNKLFIFDKNYKQLSISLLVKYFILGSRYFKLFFTDYAVPYRFEFNKKTKYFCYIPKVICLL